MTRMCMDWGCADGGAGADTDTSHPGVRSALSTRSAMPEADKGSCHALISTTGNSLGLLLPALSHASRPRSLAFRVV